MDTPSIAKTLSPKQLLESFPELRHPGSIDERVGTGVSKGQDDETSVERAEEVGEVDDAEVEDKEAKLIRCPTDDESDDDDEECLKDAILSLTERHRLPLTKAVDGPSVRC